MVSVLPLAALLVFGQVNSPALPPLLSFHSSDGGATSSGHSQRCPTSIVNNSGRVTAEQLRHGCQEKLAPAPAPEQQPQQSQQPQQPQSQQSQQSQQAQPPHLPPPPPALGEQRRGCSADACRPSGLGGGIRGPAHASMGGLFSAEQGPAGSSPPPPPFSAAACASAAGVRSAPPRCSSAAASIADCQLSWDCGLCAA